MNSPRVKLLYDIYHMQIMEGDIIRTIRENIQYIGHFHTAGNPGRTNWTRPRNSTTGPSPKPSWTPASPATWRTSTAPLGDPLAGLEEAIRICDV